MVPRHFRVTQIVLSFIILVNITSASIVSIVPDSAEQGQQFDVSITGQGTTFYIQQGSFTVSNINRIYLQQDSTTIEGGNISYSSLTRCGARFTLENDAPLGLYNVAVQQNSGGTHTLPEGFKVVPKDTVPKLISVSPSYAEQGDTLIIFVKGKNTNFIVGQGGERNVSSVYLQQDATIISADFFSALSDTTINASFSIESNAVLGLYDVAVIQDTTNDTFRLVDGFTIIPPDTMKQMVAHWDFNEGTGDTLHDRSDNKNHGIIQDGTWEYDLLTRGALRLDGVNDYVIVPHSPSLDITKKISITAWVRPEGSTGYCSVIVGKGECRSSAQWYGSYWVPMHGSNSLPWGFTVCTNPGTSDNWATVDATAGTWNFLSATFDESSDQVKIYLNGDVVSTFVEEENLTKNELAVHIGRNNDYVNMQYFSGLIGDVALYNFVLPPDSIKSIYGSFNQNDTMLEIAHWKFNEGSDDTAYDESLFRNDIKLLDGADWVEGINGKAVEFDGLDDKGLCADKACQSGWDALTIEAVIWLNEYPAANKHGPIITKWGPGSSNDDSWALDISNDTVRGIHGVIVGNRTEHIYGTKKIPLQKWSHVVFTWEDTVMALYVNGDKTDSRIIPSPGPIQNTDAELRLGHGVPSDYFNGIIDELIIYNYALSPDTIAAHYATFIPVGNNFGFSSKDFKTTNVKKYKNGFIIYNNRKIPVSISIYDVHGRNVLRRKFQASHNIINVNTSKFAKGIYFCRIKLGTEIVTKPLLVAR